MRHITRFYPTVTVISCTIIDIVSHIVNRHLDIVVAISVIQLYMISIVSPWVKYIINHYFIKRIKIIITVCYRQKHCRHPASSLQIIERAMYYVIINIQFRSIVIFSVIVSRRTPSRLNIYIYTYMYLQLCFTFVDIEHSNHQP